MNAKLKSVFAEIGTLLVCGGLFSIGYNMFMLPGKVFIGGAGGIAEVFNVLFDFPTGMTILAINVPLATLFCIFYGWKYGLKSAVGIAVTSLSIDITDALGIIPVAIANPEENAFLCAIFGGMSIGAAIGLLMHRGYTTGGSDFAALLLKLKFKNLSTAKLIAAVDAVVIIFAAIATKNFLSLFYSVVTISASSATLEFVISGFEKNKIAYIFSDKYDVIADTVSTRMKRGVTLFEGEGWYTKDKKHVVFCVVKKNELFLLKTLAKQIDPKCFIVLGDATETIGVGFKDGLEDTDIKPKQKNRRLSGKDVQSSDDKKEKTKTK